MTGIIARPQTFPPGRALGTVRRTHRYSTTLSATTTRAPTRNCDPSYPDFCIPPPPPDLDCADINGRNFTVLPPDPHGFDREGDGLGCES
jgi:hypothetical protein